jgi:hypothetical protein
MIGYVYVINTHVAVTFSANAISATTPHVSLLSGEIRQAED